MCSRVDLSGWKKTRAFICGNRTELRGRVYRLSSVGLWGDGGAGGAGGAMQPLVRLVIVLRPVCIVLCVFSFFITDALKRSNQACDV